MSKKWLRAQRHFKREVGSRGFLFLLASLPLLMALTIIMGSLAGQLGQVSTHLGLVDNAGLLERQPPLPQNNELKLIGFSTEEAGRAALDADEIDALYIIPSDFIESDEIGLVYYQEPYGYARRYFADMVRLNKLQDLPADVVERVMEGPQLSVTATDLVRTFPAGGPRIGMFIPLMLAALIAFMILAVSGSLMQSLVEEKENRTIEIIVTSVSPADMMMGKILGTFAMVLLLLVAWLGFLAAATWIGASVLDLGWLQNIEPAWREIGAMFIVALPTFLFLAAFFVFIGSTLVENQEVQQIGPLSFMVLILPVYFTVAFASHPNSNLAIAATLFPGTALVTMGIRSLFTAVPTWQVVASAAISATMAMFMIWLAARAFRLSTLRFGQRLRLEELLPQRSKHSVADLPSPQV